MDSVTLTTYLVQHFSRHADHLPNHWRQEGLAIRWVAFLGVFLKWKMRGAVCTFRSRRPILRIRGSIKTRRSRVYDHFCPVLAAVWGQVCRVFVGLGLGLESGVGLGLRPFLDPCTRTKIPEGPTNLNISYLPHCHGTSRRRPRRRLGVFSLVLVRLILIVITFTFQDEFSPHAQWSFPGQTVVTGVISSAPRYLPSCFVGHRVQHSPCSSIFI